jgi:hypothetical protein
VSKLSKKTASGKRAGSRARSKAAKPRATKTRKPAASNKPPPRDPLDQLIDAAAAALDLPVEPAWKPAVKANLRVTLRLAKLFGDFPLPDDAEPAPVFVA